MEKPELINRHTRIVKYSDEEYHLVIRFFEIEFTITLENIDEEIPPFERNNQWHPTYKIKIVHNYKGETKEFETKWFDNIYGTNRNIELTAFLAVMGDLETYIHDISDLKSMERLDYSLVGSERMKTIMAFNYFEKTYEAFNHIFDECNIGIFCSDLRDIEGEL